MNSTLHYSFIQGIYWSTYCLISNFASLYLQQRGFTNSKIGLSVGLANAAAALIQPAFAALINKTRSPLQKGMTAIFIIVAVASLLLLSPMPNFIMTVLFVIALTMVYSMQSFTNALSGEFASAGRSVNFGLARSIGSLAYAVIALIFGYVLNVMPAKYMPVSYMLSSLALCVFLIILKMPNTRNEASNGEKNVNPLRYTRFAFFLGGLFFLIIAHIFTDSFQLQIMQNVGGGSTELGISIAIASAIEMPAMVLYTRIRKKISCPALVGFCGIMWVIKIFTMFISKTPFAVYMSQILQCVSYAVYVPAGVEFVSVALPKSAYLSGQAYLGAAFTLGCLAAQMGGGVLMDKIGVSGALGIATLMSACGAALFVIAALKKNAKDA